MMNFKQLVWTDEGKPATSEPVLVSLVIGGNVTYRVLCWSDNAWRHTPNGLELAECSVFIKAWAYIPRCAFVYPNPEG